MTQSEELFNLDDLSDLPPDLMQEIVKIKGKTRRVLEVYLRADRKITLNQLIVAYYRMHKETLCKTYANTTAYRLKNRKYLKSERGKGEYSITKLGKQALGVTNEKE